MSIARKTWIRAFFVLALMLGTGIALVECRNDSLGNYSPVAPSDVGYVELAPIHPPLENLSALAVALDGTLYVGGEKAIAVMPPGEIIPAVGTPTCLAIDADGVLFAGMGDHIEVFSKDRIKTGWPSPGGKANLTSIAVDDWYVYVADAGNRRIWRYLIGGGPPREIGKRDWANGVRGFKVPGPFFDLAIKRADGSFWAVNPGRHALENYRPDGMPLSAWEKRCASIEGFGGNANPAHIALMADGAFVTAEEGFPRVKIHNPDGSFRCVVAGVDAFSAGAEGLDIAVDGQGRIYVLDPSRNQVRVFEPKKRGCD